MPPRSAPPRPRLTVVICTRNRGRQLLEACRSVLAADVDGSSSELLVVDNGSNDGSYETALELARTHPAMRVLREPRVGLSRARNAGIIAARGDVVAFLDDDAVPGPAWLSSMGPSLAEEGVMAVGGPVEPVYSHALPEWLDARFLPYLSAWDRGPEPVDLRYNEYPRGANIAFRREVFERFGAFHPRLGRRGRSLRSCEEIELCLRIERGGGVIRYLPDMHVRHHVDTSRLSTEWMEARFAAQGFSEALVEWRHGGIAVLRRGIRRLRGFIPARPGVPGGSEEVLYRCVRRAYRGYLAGALVGPWCVRRYRGDRSGRRAGSWTLP